MATLANPNPPTNLLAKGSHYTFNWGALEEHFDNDNRVCRYQKSINNNNPGESESMLC